MEQHRETNYNRPHVDPYGFAMRKIMYGLRKGLAYQGQMSKQEAQLLNSIWDLIETTDPASLEIKVDLR